MHSIMPNDEKGRCYICGRCGVTEEHHIFHGACRKHSEKYGLKVHLCHYCHNEPPDGVHHNRSNEIKLKQQAQAVAMKHYGWDIDEFRKLFRKDYR